MRKIILALLLFLSVAMLPFHIPPAFAESVEYVGSESCMECHEEIYDSYLDNRHSIKADPRTPAARMGCEACHGPGSAHVDSDGEEGMASLKADAEGSADEKSASCLDCHTKGKQAMWFGSEHQSRNIACSSCHSIHKNLEDNLTHTTQLATCGQCHKNIRAQMYRQSRHPIREGKMQCADCHNSHGTVADQLIDAQTVNQKCIECHAQVRGPFLWDHPPVVEDCLTCHTPHGSSHDGLLKAKSNFLCQRCHSNVGHPSELGARSSVDAGQSVYRVLNNRAFYRGCLNCHVAIHGTNHPSGKSLVR